MQAPMTATTIDAEAARRIQKAVEKRARQAANRSSAQPPLPTIVSDRPAAASVILPGQSGQDVIRLRIAWANLMDCGRLVEADSLDLAISEPDELAERIAAGLAEIEAIERTGRRIVGPEAHFAFEARLPKLALQFYQHSPRAQEIFVETARNAGLYNNAILKARDAADEWLNPPVRQPKLDSGKTADNRHKAGERRGRQLERVQADRRAVDAGRTGTGARGG